MAAMDRLPSSSRQRTRTHAADSRLRHRYERTQQDLPALKDRVFPSFPNLRAFLDSIIGTDGTLLYQTSRQGNRSESDTPTRVEYSCKGNTGSEHPCSYTLTVKAEDTVPRSGRKQYRICNVLDKHSCPKGWPVKTGTRMRVRVREQRPSAPAGGTSGSASVPTAAAAASITPQAARPLPAPAQAVIDLTMWNPYEEEDEEEDEADELLDVGHHSDRREDEQPSAASLPTNFVDQRNNARELQTPARDEKPSITRMRRRSSTPLPEPDWHLGKRIKREDSTSSSSTVAVSSSVRRVDRAPPSSSISLGSSTTSSSSSSSSATPSASASSQHEHAPSRSIKRESPLISSASLPTASTRARTTSSDDDDIEFISLSQQGTPLSSLNLPAHILRFCKEANVLTIERFLAHGSEKEEMGRFKLLVEDWLGGDGRGRKAMGRDFEGIVGTVKMERIFKTVRGR